MTDPRLWALVGAPSRACILRGIGADGGRSQPDLSLAARERGLRALIAGKPAPSLPWPAPVADDRLAFASEIVALLDAHRRAGDFDRLVLIAPPAMLAVLRGELSEGLRQSLVREIPRNLIAGDPDRLSRRVAELMRGA